MKLLKLFSLLFFIVFSMSLQAQYCERDLAYSCQQKGYLKWDRCFEGSIEERNYSFLRSWASCAQSMNSRVTGTGEHINEDQTLHELAEEGNAKMLKLLIDEFGADVDYLSYDNCDESPLHMAVDAGQTSAVRVLISYDANVDAKDCNGKTPLHYAAQRGYRGIMKILIAANANAHAKDDKGKTPGDYLEE